MQLALLYANICLSVCQCMLYSIECQYMLFSITECQCMLYWMPVYAILHYCVSVYTVLHFCMPVYVLLHCSMPVYITTLWCTVEQHLTTMMKQYILHVENAKL